MRGLSSLVIGVALALLVLAVGVFAYSYLREQAERVALPEHPLAGVECYAFRNGSSYVLFVVNYLDRPVESIRVSYNASGSILVHVVQRLEPGEIASVVLHGRPLTCTTWRAVSVRVINE
ncbi:MAG: hypothetical protein QXK07_07930 [Desulfurococcaceae archaeon]